MDIVLPDGITLANVVLPLIESIMHIMLWPLVAQLVARLSPDVIRRVLRLSSCAEGSRYYRGWFDLCNRLRSYSDAREAPSAIRPLCGGKLWLVLDMAAIALGK